MIYRFGTVEYDLAARTHIMGIVNVTPDSFSDGGRWFDEEAAVAHAVAMVEEGADILDVGGESTRPGAEPVPEEEELRRVIPVIRQLARNVAVPLSVDTCKRAVAEQALAAGATIVNDVSGLSADRSLADLAAAAGATLVIMHMRGTPGTMQVSPEYHDLLGEIGSFFQERIHWAEQAGVGQMMIDPGIGFGKALSHNLEILRHLQTFGRFGYPVMVGPSRKSFIGTLLDLPVDARLEGTAAAVAVAILHGAHLVRVHDVRAMKRVAKVVDAVAGHAHPVS
jgi:dihydropteroate synthase